MAKRTRNTFENEQEDPMPEPTSGEKKMKDNLDDDYNLININDIGEYTSECSRIKVTVLQKQTRTTTENQTLMQLVIMDKNKNKIKAVFWGEMANKFQHIEEGDCFQIFGFRARTNNYVTWHKYTITIGYKSKIKSLETSELTQLQKVFKEHWNFLSIKNYKQLGRDSRADVCGVFINDLGNKSIPVNERDVRKREITIMDEQDVIRVTLWGNFCDVNLRKHDVIAFSAAKLSFYQRPNVSGFGLMHVNPHCARVAELQNWLKQLAEENKLETVAEEKKEEVSKIPMKTFDEVLFSESEYARTTTIPKGIFGVIGYVASIDHYNLFTNVIPPRYKTPFRIKNDVGLELKVRAFNEVSEFLFQMQASELKRLQQQQTHEFIQVLKKICGAKTKFTFALEARVNTYRYPAKLELICQSITPVIKKQEIIPQNAATNDLPSIKVIEQKTEDAIEKKSSEELNEMDIANDVILPIEDKTSLLIQTTQIETKTTSNDSLKLKTESETIEQATEKLKSMSVETNVENKK